MFRKKIQQECKSNKHTDAETLKAEIKQPLKQDQHLAIG